MLTEGVGHRTPSPIMMRLETSELTWLRHLAAEREQRRGYANSYSTWKQGIIRLPTLVGLVGEFVMASWLSKRLGRTVSIDDKDRPEGDRGIDLSVFSVPIQVKTRTRRSDTLIRRLTEDGRLIPLVAALYVTVTWEKSDVSEPLYATLDGWTRKENLRGESEFLRGRAGNWKNLEFPDELLQPMNDMVDCLEANRKLRELKQ